MTYTAQQLNKMSKAQLCQLYRQMGGLGGMYPPEKWRKDEVISSILYAQAPRPPLATDGIVSSIEV